MINVVSLGREQAILSVLVGSGCIVGGLVSFRISDVKQSGDFVKLTFRKGKTGLQTVPLKESIVYLNEWLRVHPYKYDPDAPLWVSKDKIPPKKYSKERIHKHLSEDMVQRFVHKMAKKAGIKKRVYPHLFRHTCTNELAKEWTEPMLRAFLGWERNSNMPYHKNIIPSHFYYLNSLFSF